MFDTHTNTSTARLVLAVGSRAGREAPLQYGYYMIGRHSECQIRPKSRSVSRRHCLLYQDDTGLRVLDLKSTAGTRVNELRLRTKTWATLRHGDMLRCGKVVFRVDLGSLARGDHPAPTSSHDQDGARSVPVGQAWHDVDIAGFLENQDDVDRERRYQHIRSSSERDLESSENSQDDLQTTIEMDVDLDLFDDAFNDPQPHSSKTAATNVVDERAMAETNRADSSRQKDAASTRAKTTGKQGKSLRLPKAAGSLPRPKSPRRFSFAFSPDADHLKLMGLAVLMLVVLGVVGYSAYSFYTGPSVRVLQNID